MKVELLPYAGSAGTAKSDPQTAAIRDLLKVHASEYCQDLDFGAARFCENYNRAVGMAADPTPFDIKDEAKLHLDEDVMTYHVRLPLLPLAKTLCPARLCQVSCLVSRYLS